MSKSNLDGALLAFFSNPNVIWPGMDTRHPAAPRISEFLDAAADRGECPLVLPRRDISGQASIVYVVCWDRAHAGRMRPLLRAAVADHLSPFDGRVALLRDADPVEAAVLSIAGPGTSFLLRPPGGVEAQLIVALERLVMTLRGKPRRTAAVPKPVGRMLRELDLALAAGAVAQSATILQEIERAGGISHENIAFLQIQRLGRLGRDRELLAHGSLPTIVYTEPPNIVRQMVLSAWGRHHLHTEGGLNVDLAAQKLADEPIDIGLLVDGRAAAASDPDALSVAALVALARGDVMLGEALHANPGLPAKLGQRLCLELLAGRDREEPEGEKDGDHAAADTMAPTVAEGESLHSLPSSWLDWIAQLGEGVGAVPATAVVEAWEHAWRVDNALSQAIDDLPDLATDALLSGVAAFLDTADDGRPAPLTAGAFVRRYLVEERFGPADLSALAALLSIFLSSAPRRDEYAALLDDIANFAPQWSSISSAAQTLDLADAVSCGPRVDPDAQAQFFSAVLGPLYNQRQRLSAGLRGLASLITSDAALNWDWAVVTAGAVDASPELPAGLSVLIYSLDEGTLARVTSSLAATYPALTVHQSSDKVGTPSLRQHSRRADLTVIATGRATHAATGFITTHARGRICYPDGSGAASMLRVIESCLEEMRLGR